ncbi:hypothetical protein AB0I81_55965 [Nonomuraea sp. NPDC050404]|uniref:hypothetical protein n=1 Tax=Nonomuraea sp. NPDC050404 TaxID=3155783 RepID=UPI0033CB0DB1
MQVQRVLSPVTGLPANAHPALTVTAAPTTVGAGNDTTITISGTSNGARIDVSAVNGTGGTTGSLPSFSTISSFGGGITSATEVGTVDRLALPNLTNEQSFSYTLTVTIDDATTTTTAGAFTSRAQFYTSGGSTLGPTTGPVITITTPLPDLKATKTNATYNTLTQVVTFRWNLTNIGTAPATGRTVTMDVTPTGLLSASGIGCTGGPDNETCPGPDLGVGASANAIFPRAVSLLALGNYTVTIPRHGQTPTRRTANPSLDHPACQDQPGTDKPELFNGLDHPGHRPETPSDPRCPSAPGRSPPHERSGTGGIGPSCPDVAIRGGIAGVQVRAHTHLW